MCPSPTPDLEGAPAGSPGSAAVPQHPGIAAIRTLALAGPAGAGKTSLAEALLLKAGAIKSAGSIEKGSTVSDHDPLEKRMQHSLQAAQMHLQHNGFRVHLLDNRFDDVVGLRYRVDCGGRRDAGEGRVAIRSRQLALRHELVEASLNRLEPAFERAGGHVMQMDGEPGIRERLGDAVAHGARPDHADDADGHAWGLERPR